MKVTLASFRTRLVLGAVLWITLGFAVSWLVLANLLQSHVTDEFVSELDHHAAELAELAALDAAGQLSLRAELSDFRFSEPRSGYYWQITQTAGGTLASASLDGVPLQLALDPGGNTVLRHAIVPGPTGQAMLLERLINIGSPIGPTAHVVLAIDTRLIGAYIGGLEKILAIAMACLAAGLILAAIAQISFALRPLARIDLALQAVKQGDAPRMPTDLPIEVRSLIDNLNALLDKNEIMIQRARLQAGNLAHALKSSLAHLQIEADALSQTDNRGAVVQQHCDSIHRQIDYQLARARATASRMGGTHATRVGPVIENVVAALRRLHGDRGLIIATDPTPIDALIACGAEDLEEVLGNLIDNGAKWAAGRVLVSAALAGEDKLQIRIEDDGPGMPPDMHERVFQPGQRLDESTPGSGLGLAIARDVVGLYDGRLWIEQSRLGGSEARRLWWNWAGSCDLDRKHRPKCPPRRCKTFGMGKA